MLSSFAFKFNLRRYSVVLQHVDGLGSSTRLRCRLAGHYLPVHVVSWGGQGGQVVVDVDVSPPAGYLPFEGVAMLETMVGLYKV